MNRISRLNPERLLGRKLWVLRDGEPVPEPDVMKWGQWYENAANRIVAKTKIGDAEVSTVFLGLDHSFGEGEPVLWETMIFGGVHDQYQDRYTSKEAALAGHEVAVALVRKTLNEQSLNE